MTSEPSVAASDRDERPPRYVEPAARPGKGELDTVVYRASGFGMCERALVAIANDYPPMPPPEWFQRVLDEGSDAEQQIRDMWAAGHGRPDSTVAQCLIELEVGELYGRRVIIRAHADDVLGNSLEGYVLREYKKFRDSTWPAFLRQGVEIHANYPWQVAVMMHGLAQVDPGNVEVVCEFVGGHWDGDKISEVDGKLLIDPPIPLKGILLRVAKLERMIHDQLDVNDVPCRVMWPCGFWNMPWIDGCNKAMGGGDIPEVKVNAALVYRYADLAKQSSSLTATAKLLDKERKELGKTIIAAWPDEPDPDNPIKKVRVDDLIVTRVRAHYPSRTTKAYDTDSFKIGEAD